MPKQTFHINRFEGGMNTDFAPEDLPDNSLLDALGISVSRIGRVTMSGDPHSDKGITHIASTENPGYGLFSFNSDYSQTDAESATSYLALQNGSQVQIWDGANWNDDSLVPFDLGAGDTSNATEPSYYAPNGDLRVCDGKFNHLNNYDNNVKWFGYIPNNTYGTGTADATVGGWAVEDASIECGYPKDSSGLATNAFMADNESSAKGGGGDEYNSTNQRYGYVPGTRDWGLQLAYVSASDSKTDTDFADSTWMPSTDTEYKFYASYLYSDGQEGHPVRLTMFPTLRGYAPGKVGSETSGNATVTSSESLQFVDRQYEGDDSSINVGIANFSRSVRTVTVTNKYTDATMDISSGDATVTHDNWGATDKGILVGQHVSGPGIPSNSYVKSITDATHFELGDSDGNEVTATATTTNVSDGAIGRENSLVDGDKVIVKGTDNFDGTWEISNRNASSFQFTHTESGTIDGDSTEQGYFSKVGTNQAIYFSVGLKLNNDETTDFNFGASTLTATSGGNQRIIGSRVYWSSSEDGHGDLWIMFEANFEKGLKAYGIGKDTPVVTDYMDWTNTNDSQDDLVVDFRAEGFGFNVWKHPPRYETYESLNGYSHTSKLDAKWKTAVIANGRAYIANVKRRQKATFNVNDTALTTGKQAWDSTFKNDPTFGDRILKSPVDRFDTFPEEMAIELFGGDDGDQIVKLETFADRLFVFKKNTLHIINIAKDVEILESSHKGMGLDGGLPCQSCMTSTGIAWMNSNGVFHYNGQGISSLTDNKIELFWKGGASNYRDVNYTSFWMSNASDSPSIGFDGNSNKLIIHKTSTEAGSDKETVLIFDMKINAWTWLNQALDNEARTNMVSYDGDIVYYEDDGSSALIYRYNDTPHAPGHLDLTVGDAMHLVTKPFNFGTPLQRKKIYKVYITYRTNDAVSNVHVQYYVNGNPAYRNFQSSTSNPFASSDNITMAGSVAELDNTANAWTTAVLKPATSSEANNIKSFGLRFFNEASNNIDSGFEINDITIVYRNKSVK